MGTFVWIRCEYGILIDIALYFSVFAAVARDAFAPNFPGRDGRVLAVAVGLLLAVALRISQWLVGLSLERLGPAAVYGTSCGARRPKSEVARGFGFLYSLDSARCAPVAQLDRAFDYESKGRKFESCRAHF